MNLINNKLNNWPFSFQLSIYPNMKKKQKRNHVCGVHGHDIFYKCVFCISTTTKGHLKAFSDIESTTKVNR